MSTSTNQSFSFQPEELAKKLILANHSPLTGYWQLQYQNDRDESQQTCFLGVSNGKIVYSGAQQLSWKNFLKIVVRYTPGLRNSTKKALLSTEPKLNSNKPFCLAQMLEAIEKTSIVTQSGAIAALRSKILSDLDNYLLSTSGNARFENSAPEFVNLNPEIGLSWQELISQAKQRRIMWHKLKTQIPSTDSKPIVNSDKIQSSQLTPAQKQRLHSLLKNGRTLEAIAATLGKDTLEIAKFFYPFISGGLIKIIAPAKSIVTATPKILIVDDSPILTKQFQSLVTKWGYQIEICHDPMLALDKINNCRPAIAFIDINMPGVSGFDLVKLIRKESAIASIPTVILTAEDKLSNKWRANWSNCRFLTKPLASEGIKLFQAELFALLQELAPISAPVAVA